jgi:hypothetical protein
MEAAILADPRADNNRGDRRAIGRASPTPRSPVGHLDGLWDRHPRVVGAAGSACAPPWRRVVGAA